MNPLLIRRRGMMKARQGGMIPIAWLQGSPTPGETWINTGIKGLNTISVEGAFINNGQGVSTENNWIFGSRTTNDQTSYFALLIFNSTLSGFSWRRGSNASLPTHPNDNEEVLFSNIVDLNKLVLTYNNNTFTVVGSTAYQGNNSDIGLFTNISANGLPSTTNPSDSVKLEWIKFYDSGILVRDFIPVRVGTVGYMYDRVSGQLFGNAGTGDFVLGPDVI